MEVNESRSRPTVPYTSWGQFKVFLDRIRILNPKIIDQEFLRMNQMGGEQPGPLFGSIQFLELIESTGAPSSNLEKLKVKGEEQYKSTLAEIVRQGYSDLFGAIDVSLADKDMIYNQIRSVYQCSPRVAKTATPFFIALCNEAGIEIQAAILPQTNGAETRTRKTSAHSNRTRTESAKNETVRSSYLVPDEENHAPVGQNSVVPQVALHITVDPTMTSEQMDKLFASMKKHLIGGGS